MFRRNPPPIKFSDFESWLRRMIVNGEVIMTVELFKDNSRNHHVSFLFPNRKSKDTDEENELDDLKKFFLRISNPFNNKLNNKNQHFMSMTIPDVLANGQLVEQLLSLNELVKEQTLINLAGKGISQSKNPKEDIQKFLKVCKKNIKLAHQKKDKYELRTIENILQKCVLFYEKIKNSKNNEAKTHSKQILEFMQNEYYRIMNSSAHSREARNQFCLHFMGFLLVIMENRYDRINNPNHNHSKSERHQKYNYFLNQLSRLINIINRFPDNLPLQIANELIHHCFAQLKNENQPNDLDEVIELVGEYAHILCIMDPINDLPQLQPLKFKLIENLMKYIRATALKGEKHDGLDLAQILTNYSAMQNQLAALISYNKNLSIPSHIIDEFINYSNMIIQNPNALTLLAEFNQDMVKALDFLDEYTKSKSTFNIPDAVRHQFITEQFAQLHYPIKKFMEFKKSVERAYDPLLSLGRLAYLIEREQQSGKKNKEPYQLLARLIDETFTHIASQPDKDIYIHLDAFQRQYNSIMMKFGSPNLSQKSGFFCSQIEEDPILDRVRKIAAHIEALSNNAKLTPSKTNNTNA